ncbi:MAG: hypothetical protein WB791_05730 [Waddliaceae bacterium]
MSMLPSLNICPFNPALTSKYPLESSLSAPSKASTSSSEHDGYEDSKSGKPSTGIADPLFINPGKPISQINTEQHKYQQTLWEGRTIFLDSAYEMGIDIDQYLREWSPSNHHNDKPCIRLLRKEKQDVFVPVEKVQDLAKVLFTHPRLIIDMAQGKNNFSHLTDLFQEINDKNFLDSLFSKKNVDDLFPVHLAIVHLQENVLHTLLTKGANPIVFTKEGSTLDFATRIRREKFHDLLEKRDNPAEASYLIEMVVKILKKFEYDSHFVAQWKSKQERKFRLGECSDPKDPCYTPIRVFLHQKCASIMNMLGKFGAAIEQEVADQEEDEFCALVDNKWVENESWKLLGKRKADCQDPKKDKTASNSEPIDIPFESQLINIASDLSESEISRLNILDFKDYIEEYLDDEPEQIEELDNLSDDVLKEMWMWLKKYKTQTVQHNQEENTDHHSGNYGPIRHHHDHKSARYTPYFTQKTVLRCYPHLNEIRNLMLEALVKHQQFH